MLETAITSHERTASLVDVVTTQIGPGLPKLSDRVHHLYSPAASLAYEEITPNSEGSRNVWKSFEHYKRFTRPATALEVLYYWDPYDLAKLQSGGVPDPYFAYTDVRNWVTILPFGDPGKLDQGLPPMHIRRSDGGFVPPPADLDMLKRRALDVMLPAIKAELSLVNSLIELKDLKRSVLTVRNTFKRFKNLWDGESAYGFRTVRLAAMWKRYNRNRSPLTLRGVSQMMAGGYLEYSFNLAPLVSDIRSIHAALTRTRKRINDLVTRAGRAQRRHFAFNWYEVPDYRHDVYETSPYTVVEPQAHSYCAGYSCERDCWTEPTSFHAELDYNYNFNRYQLEIAQVSGMLDALGVNLNPAIIWNAIPFSFVVDWFIGVSRWLDQFQVRNMDPLINIHQFLWSVRRSRRIIARREIVQATSPLIPVGQKVPFPVVYESSYRRQVEPLSTSSVQLSGLNVKEFSLGAAMVIATRRHQYRRLR